MKRCPNCQNTYTDESLNFCIEDGTTLVGFVGTTPSHDSGATLVMSDRTASLDVPPPTAAFVPRGMPTDNMPPVSVTTRERPRYTAPDAYLTAEGPQPRSPLLIAGVTAIAILLLVLVGIGIALLMRGSGNSSEANNSGTTNNGNSSTGTKTDNSTTKSNENNQSTTERGSLQVTATASSTRVPFKALSYAPSNALDDSLLTAWIEGVPGPGIGEWIQFDFDREVKLKSVLMTPGYFKNTQRWRENNRLAAATLHFSDGSSRRFSFPDKMQQQRLDVGGIRTRFVRLVIEDYYPGSVDSEDTPISQITFEWEP